MDAEGNLTLVELKRDRTPRDVVAQILDYASILYRNGINEIEKAVKYLREIYGTRGYFKEGT